MVFNFRLPLTIPTGFFRCNTVGCMVVTAYLFASSVAHQVLALEPPKKLTVRMESVMKLEEKSRNGRIYDMAISPADDPCVCVFALEQVVQLWLVSSKPRMISSFVPSIPPRARRDRSAGSPHPIAFSSDGGKLAFAYFGEVQIWDVKHRTISYTIPFLWEPEVVRFSRTGADILVGCSWRGLFSIQGKVPSKLELVPKTEYERGRWKSHDNHLANQHLFRLSKEAFSLSEIRDIYCLAISTDNKLVYTGGGPVFGEIAEAALGEIAEAATSQPLVLQRKKFHVWPSCHPCFLM
jgi:hypothetical protein